MTRGIIEPPNLDDRTWQDIVDEARALIPSYAPEWTDHNPSDIGIALVELFAWMAEGMIYRINRIPEKHFVEFLNLLGISRDPATPATAFVSFKLAPSATPTLIDAGNQVATAQTDAQDAIVFETDTPVTAVATNLTTALHIAKVLFIKYRNISKTVVNPPQQGEAITIPAGISMTLTLGFDTAVTDPIPLIFRLFKPLPETGVDVDWLYSRGTLEPTSWPVLAGVVDDTNSLSRNGNVSLTIPADWATQKPTGDWSGISANSMNDQVTQSLFWVGIRISNLTPDPLTLQIDGIYCNAAPATSALTIATPETIAESDGSAFQNYELDHAPIYQEPGLPDPYSHLEVEVRVPQVGNTFGPWTTWQRVDELTEGEGEVYRLDPVRGMIFFGNYDSSLGQGAGTIPPKYAEIRALKYRHVAGDSHANVPGGTITVVRTPVADVISVVNPGAASGGSDEEEIEETKRRAPQLLRNRYRAVTVEDYAYLAREATTDIAKVTALGPRLFTSYDTKPAGVNDGDPWTYGGLIRSAGTVYVVIIPNTPSEPAPMPPEELIAEVTDFLAPRRPLNTVLQVVAPRYLPIRVIASVRVWQQAIDSGKVDDPLVSNSFRDSLTTQAKAFLHPLTGNSENDGFKFGGQLLVAGLFSHLAPPEDIGFIESIQIEAQTPLYTPVDRPYPIAVPGVSILLADYETICSHTTHTITVMAI